MIADQSAKVDSKTMRSLFNAIKRGKLKLTFKVQIYDNRDNINNTPQVLKKYHKIFLMF